MPAPGSPLIAISEGEGEPYRAVPLDQGSFETSRPICARMAPVRQQTRLRCSLGVLPPAGTAPRDQVVSGVTLTTLLSIIIALLAC